MVNSQQKSSIMGKALRCILIVAFLSAIIPSNQSVFASQSEYTVYLPLVRNGTAPSTLPLMSGVYPLGWPNTDTINNELKPLDNWLTGVTGGRSTTIFGSFLPLDLTDATVKQNVEVPLTVIWEAGYVPFINLGPLSGDSAWTVATSSKYDSLLRIWARSFKTYADNGNRFAYIAPLQEMNGAWVTYGGDPAGYIAAFKRFQTIFTEVGVPRESVKWVFAPNGWTHPDLPPFEDYYPGAAFVDVVAISAYNFGYCNGGGWEEPEDVFNPDRSGNEGHYLDRMAALAPGLPIFIAQTATSSYRYAGGGQNASEKERWLRDAYQFLASDPNVKAVIYFNLDKECDWAIFKNSSGNPGYRTGIIDNGYNYIQPTTLMHMAH